MIDTTNFLNMSFPSFEDNNNDFFQFPFLSKYNAFFDNLQSPTSSSPNIFNYSFLDEYPDNPLTKENSKILNSINNCDKLFQTTVIKKENTIKTRENIIQDEPPAHFTFDKIQNIINKLNLSDDIKNKIVKDSNLNRIEREMSDKKLMGKKKRRKTGKIKFTDERENKIKGRKKAEDNSKRKHDRNSADNIIKKVKKLFMEYSLKFINNILNSYLAKKKIIEYMRILGNNKRYYSNEELDNIIKALDYKFIDKIKKEKELSLLNLPLKDIFSNKISPKYSTIKSDYNKNMIDLILNDERDNVNIMFAFNLTFGEWIDIFTYKRKLESFENLNEVNIKELEDKFVKVEKLINEIYQKNYNKNYLSYFISYTFNYKRWFIMKKGRNRITNKIA